MNKRRLVTAEELKTIELDILQDIHDFCKENGLRCFLASGTLIGAIRHKGFIPWDDDADVMMPRPDYDKFIHTYKSDKYILNYPTKPGYYQSIVKVSDPRTELIQDLPLADEPIGLHIDVLPLDGEPDNINKFVEHETELLRLFHLSWELRARKFHHRIRDSLFKPKQLLRIILKNIRNRNIALPGLYKQVEDLAHKYDYNSSTYVGYITMSLYKYKQRHRRELFEESVPVEFEGREFYAPKGYHEYLTNLFGDYMQLPPEEKRQSHHVWTAYWKEY